eukprot:9138234-Alexandrium_andersonii.AAC.1
MCSSAHIETSPGITFNVCAGSLEMHAHRPHAHAQSARRHFLHERCRKGLPQGPTQFGRQQRGQR